VLVGDKGYDSKKLRGRLRRRGTRAQIPKRVWPSRRPRRGRPIKKDKPSYKKERAFGWMQRKYRRLVVRWERRSVYFNAFLQLALVHFWIILLLPAFMG
jgi:hypothetical protein